MYEQLARKFFAFLLFSCFQHFFVFFMIMRFYVFCIFYLKKVLMCFTFLAILVHDPPSYAPEPPTSDAPDQSVFERLVKSYYHAKFWASSSKIDRVMAILAHDPPSYAPEPPTLLPLI